MKYDATEIIGAGEDSISSLELALSELEGIEQYDYQVKCIKDLIEDIQDVMREHEDEAHEIWDRERQAQDAEYYEMCYPRV